jgi:hypothetical protein
MASGAYCLVQTRLRGRTWLRTTIMNPLTERRDLEGLVAAVRQEVTA